MKSAVFSVIFQDFLLGLNSMSLAWLHCI